MTGRSNARPEQQSPDPRPAASGLRPSSVAPSDGGGRPVRRARVVGQIAVSLLMTIACVAYVLRGVDCAAVGAELRRLTPAAVGLYGLTLA